MGLAFIVFAPIVVGAVTVYVAEREARRSWVYYFVVAAFANVLFILGTMLVMIEGLICVIVIAPVFFLIGGLSGLAAGAICRKTMKSKEALLGLAFLPMLASPLEAGLPLPQSLAEVERTVVIMAPPERVWRELLDAKDIRPEEVRDGWVFRIGVPVPVSGTTRDTPEGKVRHVTMGKDVSFDELITHSDENRYLRWVYRFTPESFPPYALDEHVVIGGHYFDLKNTAYTLNPMGDGTQLTVRIGYRVSTRFNWYAVPVARLLMEDLGEANLAYYKRRAERAS
ncbi:hypothetical protein BWI17_00035 [Betaproteobacteria bacterium GR16-43]|nr:hypothetical protein BWI17_00035 [Betaproteobacteria bacterium GR16-43]